MTECLVVAVLLVATAFLHISVPGLVPSGGDGGNWLALAYERFGIEVMSAEVTYPPLLPTLLGLLRGILGDSVLAVSVVGVLAKATLVVAVYVSVRTLTRWYALLAAVVVGLGGALLEAYAWGGYPQLMGMGFGILATFLVVRYLSTQTAWHLWMGVAFCIATLLTHTMVGGLLGVAMTIAVFHYLFMTDARAAQRRRGFRVGLMVAGSVLAISVAGFIVSSSRGFEATVNPIGLSRLDAIVMTIREAPYPWLLIALAGASVLFFGWQEYVASTVAVGFSWAVSSLLLFIATAEPRALLMTQVGLVLMATVGLAALRESMRHSSGWRRSGRPLLAIAGVSVVAAVAAGGLALYVTATDWYRVVDRDEITALNRLSTVSASGEIVISGSGHHGNPIGWWVEGYAGLPTYTAINPAFLAFPEEREQADIARTFFSGGLSSEESLALLDEIGAQYVVVDRRHADSSWLDSEVAASFQVIDDASNLVILEVSPDT